MRVSPSRRGRVSIAALCIVTAVPALGQELIFEDAFESTELCGWSVGLQCISDAFDADIVEGWQVLNPQDADVSVVGGRLRIAPDANTLWFNASSSILVWRQVTGDFKVTARVTTRRLPPNDADPPLPTVRLGGLMARDPAGPDPENYVFLVVGADVDDVSVEAKTTVNSVSSYDGSPQVADGVAWLRVCRLGSTFRLAWKTDDGPWQLHPVYGEVVRSDLPATLQVGPLAYALQPDPDVQILYDSVDFRTAPDLDSCLE